MSDIHRFDGRLTWTGSTGGTPEAPKLARAFRVEFADKPAIAGSSPAVFGGDHAQHNPETLMVASLAACHHLTYLAVCERARIGLAAYSDEATGLLGPRDGRVRMLEVTLRPRVRVLDPAQAQRALALHEKAHANCFMANSVNFEVRVVPVIEGPDGTRLCDA